MRALLQLQHSTNSSSQLANTGASSTAATAGGSGNDASSGRWLGVLCTLVATFMDAVMYV